MVSSKILRYFPCLGSLVRFCNFKSLRTFGRGDYKCSGPHIVANSHAAAQWSLRVFWYRRTRSLIFNTRGNWESHIVKKCVPPMSVLRPLPLVVAYVSVHSSLVIGMLLSLVRLKECGLGTQILGLDRPLSEVGTGVEQHIYSSPHRLIAHT